MATTTLENGIASEICKFATDCKLAFSESVSSPLLGSQAWIRSAQGDFNLWCAGINATRADRSSLDYRLRNRSDVRDTVCDLLKALFEALSICQHLMISDADETIGNNDEQSKFLAGTDPDGAFSNASWDSFSNESTASSSSVEEASDPMLAEQVMGIKTILNQLQRISLAIRKSGDKYRFERADNKLAESRYQDFRNHLTTVILKGFEDIQSKELSTTEKVIRSSDFQRLSQVQRRLIHANIVRRNRIEFATGTRENMDYSTRLGEPSLPSHEEMPVPSGSTSQEAKDKPSSVASRNTVDRQNPTATKGLKTEGAPTIVVSATNVGSQLDIRHLLGRPSPTTATRMTRISATQVYPGSPAAGLDGSVICPYCNVPLPWEFARSRHNSDWRRHVAQDLLPYCCIVEDCATPDELYLTTDRLIAHTLDQHSFEGWACDYCAYGEQEDSDASQTSQPTFSHAEDWISHVQLYHTDRVPPDLCAKLAAMNKRRMFGPLACPLCEFKTVSMSSKVDDHILQHIHQFALRALPENDEFSDAANSETSQKSLVLSHTDLTTTGIVNPVYDVDSVSYDDILYSLGWLEGMYPTVPFHERFEPLYAAPRLDFFSDLASHDYWTTQALRFQASLSALQWVVGTDNVTVSHEDMRDEVLDNMDELSTTMQLTPRTPQDPDVSPQGPHHILPPPPTTQLIGREDILEELESLFHINDVNSSDQLRVALVGPETTNKSSVARVFVDKLLQSSEDISVFWVNARSESAIEQDYDTISEELHSLPHLPGHATETQRHLPHYLTWAFGGSWVMVFDGLSSAGALHLCLNNLIPRGRGGKLLFTTSEPRCLSLLGPSKVIQVPYSRGWRVISAKLKTLVALSHFLTRYEDMSFAKLPPSPTNPSLGLDQAAVTSGRPPLWTSSAQRKMTRLYLYTTLPVNKILEVVHAGAKPGSIPGRDSANTKLNALLDKEPRWLRPRTDVDLHRRISALATYPTRSSQAPHAEDNTMHTSTGSILTDEAYDKDVMGQLEKIHSDTASDPKLSPRATTFPPSRDGDLLASTNSALHHPRTGAIADIPTVVERTKTVTSDLPQSKTKDSRDATDDIRNLRLPTHRTAKSDQELFDAGVLEELRRILADYSPEYVNRVLSVLREAIIERGETSLPLSQTLDEIRDRAATEISPLKTNMGLIPEDILNFDRNLNHDLCRNPHESRQVRKSCFCRLLDEEIHGENDDWVLWVHATRGLGFYLSSEARSMIDQIHVEGALSDRVDRFGNTALHLVAARAVSHDAFIDAVLQSTRQTLTAKNSAGQTFLHVLEGTWFDHGSISHLVQLLRGVSKILTFDRASAGWFNITDIYGRTFFHLLRSRNEVTFVASKQALGIVFDAAFAYNRDAFGETARHLPSLRTRTIPETVGQEDHDTKQVEDSALPVDSMVGQHAGFFELIQDSLWNPKIEDEEGRNALHCLAEVHSSQIAKLAGGKLGEGQSQSHSRIRGSSRPEDLPYTSTEKLNVQSSLVQSLLEADVSVNHYNKAGNTVLMAFVAHLPEDGDHKMPTKILRQLVDGGADIHARNRQGETALHVAARLGRKLATRELVVLGANVHVRDGRGRSLLETIDEELCRDTALKQWAHLEACRAWLSGAGGAVIDPSVTQEWGMRIGQ